MNLRRRKNLKLLNGREVGVRNGAPVVEKMISATRTYLPYAATKKEETMRLTPAEIKDQKRRETESDKPYAVNQYIPDAMRNMTGVRRGTLTVRGWSSPNRKWAVECDCGVHALRAHVHLSNPTTAFDSCADCVPKMQQYQDNWTMMTDILSRNPERSAQALAITKGEYTPTEMIRYLPAKDSDLIHAKRALVAFAVVTVASSLFSLYKFLA